ncbi:MAG TPA: RNA methyltransferase substrate-binding domain-containing protein, partial [Gammaproteobacteria bacterium]|nr:RNA methyltransferase substrate-binding domain-containing protein [Gammaproteobacteria bacterium]
MADGKAGWIYGIHAVAAMLDRRPEGIVAAALLRGARAGSLPEIERRLIARGVRVEHLDRADLDRLTGGGAHQGVAVRTTGLAEIGVSELEAVVLDRGRALRLLVLDQVQDPRNLGACLRSADAAGVDAVVIPKDRSAKLTPAA